MAPPIRHPHVHVRVDNHDHPQGPHRPNEPQRPFGRDRMDPPEEPSFFSEIGDFFVGIGKGFIAFAMWIADLFIAAWTCITEFFIGLFSEDDEPNNNPGGGVDPGGGPPNRNNFHDLQNLQNLLRDQNRLRDAFVDARRRAAAHNAQALGDIDHPQPEREAEAILRDVQTDLAAFAALPADQKVEMLNRLSKADQIRVLREIQKNGGLPREDRGAQDFLNGGGEDIIALPVVDRSGQHFDHVWVHDCLKTGNRAELNPGTGRPVLDRQANVPALNPFNNQRWNIERHYHQAHPVKAALDDPNERFIMVEGERFEVPDDDELERLFFAGTIDQSGFPYTVYYRITSLEPEFEWDPAFQVRTLNFLREYHGLPILAVAQPVPEEEAQLHEEPSIVQVLQKVNGAAGRPIQAVVIRLRGLSATQLEMQKEGILSGMFQALSRPEKQAILDSLSVANKIRLLREIPVNGRLPSAIPEAQNFLCAMTQDVIAVPVRDHCGGRAHGHTQEDWFVPQENDHRHEASAIHGFIDEGDFRCPVARNPWTVLAANPRGPLTPELNFDVAFQTATLNCLLQLHGLQN